jgi:hypothetical protein
MEGMMRWQLIGIDFHSRWRSGSTQLDLRGNSFFYHHGWYSLEWARGSDIEWFKSIRRQRHAIEAGTD